MGDGDGDGDVDGDGDGDGGWDGGGNWERYEVEVVVMGGVPMGWGY